MAVDVCSEIVWSCGSSPGISPRISFSHDLKGCDHVPVETCCVASDSASDFDFCITASHFFLELSRPADELFSDGKILPVPVIRKESHTVTSDPDPRNYQPIWRPPSIDRSPPRPQNPPPAEKKQLKELLSFDSEESPRPTTKSFWSFSRSSSLNCESLRSKGLIRSLQFLARSNSTGSVLNANPDRNNAISRGNSKKGQHPCTGRRSVSSSASGVPFGYDSSARKSYGGGSGGGGGVRVSPVLNFQPPVCIGNVGLFGIGSFFCSRKLRKKKK